MGGGGERHYCVASCIKFPPEGENQQIISSSLKNTPIHHHRFLGETWGILKPFAL